LGIGIWVSALSAVCQSMRTVLWVQTGADGKRLASRGAAPVDAAALV